MANAGWKVLPHGELEKLGSHLYYVWGSLEGNGPPLKRVMTVAKKSNGGTVIHNGICLSEESMRTIETWGKPEELIVPNGYHRMDAPAFKERYPSIRVICPAGARKKVEEVVTVDATYEDFGKDDRVRFENVEGTKNAEGVMIVTGDDGVSLVFNDAIFNMPHLPGFTGWVLKHVTASSGGPRISRIARFALIKDKAAFRAHLERLADTPKLVRVVVSHHEVIAENPRDVLLQVARTV